MESFNGGEDKMARVFAREYLDSRMHPTLSSAFWAAGLKRGVLASSLLRASPEHLRRPSRANCPAQPCYDRLPRPGETSRPHPPLPYGGRPLRRDASTYQPPARQMSPRCNRQSVLRAPRRPCTHQVRSRYNQINHNKTKEIVRRPIRSHWHPILPPLRLPLRLTDALHPPRHTRRPQRKVGKHAINPLLPRAPPESPRRHPLPLPESVFDEPRHSSRLYKGAYIEHRISQYGRKRRLDC